MPPSKGAHASCGGVTKPTPRDLLEFLENRCQGRKWRLFMCACGRRCLDQMPSAVFRNAVATSEAYADGFASTETMSALAHDASRELQRYYDQTKPHCAGSVAIEAASLGGAYLFECTVRLIDFAACITENEALENAVQAQLVRDIFGNPFQPVVFHSEWLTSTVRALAHGMYESRDFSAMPILADALQDARCEDGAILDHCRDPHGVHVCGCWVVDLVLGKS